MELKQFSSDQHAADSFVRFAEDLYRDDNRWIPPLRDRQIAAVINGQGSHTQSEFEHRHILAFAGRNPVGRISAFVNPMLVDEMGEPVATVGNFECINDVAVAEDLLGAAFAWIGSTSRYRKVWGPMNYDIWHGYRFMTRGFDRQPFCSEPYNKAYYPGMFERFGFRVRQVWHSVELNGRDMIVDAMKRGRERYEQVLQKGYRFHSFDLRRYTNEVINLYHLLNRSFSGFLGFTPTNFAEFRKIFQPNRVALDPSMFVFVRDENDTLCGFAGSFLDVADGVRAMRGEENVLARCRFVVNKAPSNRIIFYLGGITPEEAQKRAGLGRAAFYHVLREALHRGYSSVVVALMAEGNIVRGVLNGRGTTAQREYALYEYSLAV